MRLFIAMPISEELKRKIGEYQKTLHHLPLRLTPPHNLHITLVFLGEVPSIALPAIERAIEHTLSNFRSRILPAEVRQSGRRRASKITLTPLWFEVGPNPRFPRLIWLSFKPSTALAILQTNLARALEKEGPKQFTPHITIARLKHNERLDPENVLAREMSQALFFAPKEIYVMKSTLKRSGAEYNIVTSFPL